jgi:hypothetical protein
MCLQSQRNSSLTYNVSGTYFKVVAGNGVMAAKVSRVFTTYFFGGKKV